MPSENGLHYSEVCAEGGLEALRELADAIVEQADVRVLREPRAGMVMVRHVDPLEHTAFYMGEAHVTECEVEVDGRLGYGCVLGSGEDRAFYAALVDAVMASGGPLRAEVEAKLKQPAEAIMRARQDESRLAASTRVDFEVR
jgi:alpha-D-ribose 1-methylphosphonate 5-triphosphate synthase subunit PhnG